MCTAIADGKRGVTGRTLDVARRFGEEALLLPRDCPLPWEGGRHLAILGVGRIEEGTPLLFDGMNERGLWGAALRYPEAVWNGGEGREVPSFALLAEVLGRCGSIGEARAFLVGTRATNRPFSAALPAAPLHFLFADGEGALVAEPEREGLRLWDAPVGVLANSPSFPAQLSHLSLFSHLGSAPSPCRLCPDLAPAAGSGALGLPGDFSSPSRFVRAAFALRYLRGEGLPFGFAALGQVAVPKGAVENEEGRHFTVYTSVYDRAKMEMAVLPAGVFCPRTLSLRGREEGREPLSFSLAWEEEWEALRPSTT